MNTRTLCIAGAVATMMAFAPFSARADYSSTTTSPSGTMTTVTSPTATTTVITTPNTMGTYSNAMNTTTYTTPSQQSAWVNYHLLTNKHLDYMDLQGAKAAGLTDRQIAICAKVSRLANVPFKAVEAAILRGETYYQIADDYRLRDSDLTNTDEEQERIDAYRTAYNNTGEMAITKVAGNEELMSTVSGTTMVTDQNIVQTLRNSGNYTMLASAIKKAGLVSTLRGPGPFTLFAPTDAAFAKLSATDVDFLMNNKDQLRQVLNYHVIPARIDAATAMAMTSPTSPATVQGGTLNVTTTSGHVMINNATVVQPDILCTNGVIHGIDTVLVPSTVTLP